MNNTNKKQTITPKEAFSVRWPFYTGLILLNLYLYNKYGVNSMLLLDGTLLLFIGILRVFLLMLVKALEKHN